MITGKISANPEVVRINENDDGGAKVIRCQVQLTPAENVQTALYLPGPGSNALPCAGDIAVCEYRGHSLVILGVYTPSEIVNEETVGKTGLKSETGRDAGGTVVSRFILDNEGNIQIAGKAGIAAKKPNITADKEGNVILNGDTKRLVTYAELDEALKDFYEKLYNALISASNGAGTVVYANLPVKDDLDLSASETRTIKTGG
jgi:hypothetical protein